MSTSTVHDDGPAQLTAYIAEYGVDRDGQMMDPTWLRIELERWHMESGYVRENFSNSIGAACDRIEFDKRGALGTVHALTPECDLKIRGGVYKGLGVGIKQAVVKNNVIVGGSIYAVSLLDAPMRYA